MFFNALLATLNARDTLRTNMHNVGMLNSVMRPAVKLTPALYNNDGYVGVVVLRLLELPYLIGTADENDFGTRGYTARHLYID